MEDFGKVKKDVTDYVRDSFMIDPDREQGLITMNIKKLDGLSNTNYHVTISNNTTNEILSQVVYRKFGEISDVVDRELETFIIKSLSNKGIGPKIYLHDSQMRFRIDEFMVDTTPIPDNLKFESKILDQIIKILVSYSLISNVCEYKTICETQKEKFSISMAPLPSKNTSSKGLHIHQKRIKHTIFDQCMKDMYQKAFKGWETFSQEFKTKVLRENNEMEYEKLMKFEYYMRNFHEIYSKVFPSHGLLILNHNDVHRLNLIVNQKTHKMYILDHEYASMNQIGNDIANFMNESIFNYSPDYSFHPNTINFDFFYSTYLKYLKVFYTKHEYIFKDENGKEMFETIKARKYYINLHCCLNLFWLLYCGIYLNFYDYIDSKGFSYFQHGIDRIEFYEKALKELEKDDI